VVDTNAHIRSRDAQQWVNYECAHSLESFMADVTGTTTKARFPFKRNRLRCGRCVNENHKKRKTANHGCHCFDRAFLLAGACVCCMKFSRNKRKLQPIGMLGRSSGNHDWLLANASACVSCRFRLRNARNASDCVWMETGLNTCNFTVHLDAAGILAHAKQSFADASKI